MTDIDRSITVDYVAPAFPASSVSRNIRREEAEVAALRRDAGYCDGHALGLADARREVEQAIDDHRSNADRLARVIHALENASDDLTRRDALALADVESGIVAVAVELAEQLLGRELEVTRDSVIDAMTRALRVLPERGTPVLRVHPDDEATAREAAHADLVRWRGAVTVVADHRVEAGGCIVDVEDCRIDAQLGPAIERLRDTL